MHRVLLLPLIVVLSGCYGWTAVHNDIDRTPQNGLQLEVLGVRDVGDGARGSGREIRLRLRNETGATIYYVGLSETSPVVRVARFSAIGWQSDNSPTCGTGKVTFELQPGMELAFSVSLRRDAATERVRIAVFEPESAERIWSPSINLDHLFWPDDL
jgi:hypothetical protein